MRKTTTPKPRGPVPADFPSHDDVLDAYRLLAGNIFEAVRSFRHETKCGAEVTFDPLATAKGLLADVTRDDVRGFLSLAVPLLPRVNYHTKKIRQRRPDILAELAARAEAHNAAALKECNPWFATSHADLSRWTEEQRTARIRYGIRGAAGKRGRVAKFGEQGFRGFVESAERWIEDRIGRRRIRTAQARERLSEAFVGECVAPFRAEYDEPRDLPTAHAIEEVLFTRASSHRHRAIKLGEVVFGVSRSTASRYMRHVS